MNNIQQVEQENFVETDGLKDGVKNLKRKIIKKIFILLVVLLVFFLSLLTRNLSDFSHLSVSNFTNSTLNR